MNCWLGIVSRIFVSMKASFRDQWTKLTTECRPRDHKGGLGDPKTIGVTIDSHILKVCRR